MAASRTHATHGWYWGQRMGSTRCGQRHCARHQPLCLRSSGIAKGIACPWVTAGSLATCTATRSPLTRWWRCKERYCGSCSRNKWKRLYIYILLLNTTPVGSWHALNCPSKHPTPTRVQPRRGTDRFWHRDKKLEAANLPPAPSALCGSWCWGVARCTPAVVGMK